MRSLFFGPAVFGRTLFCIPSECALRYWDQRPSFFDHPVVPCGAAASGSEDGLIKLSLDFLFLGGSLVRVDGFVRRTYSGKMIGTPYPPPPRELNDPFKFSFLFYVTF